MPPSTASEAQTANAVEGVALTDVQATAKDIDLNDPSLYLNRELTWLEFNRRVLNEAGDSRNPLLERLKFVAIVSGNIDEFFMKRIGGLKLQLAAGVKELTVDGRTPGEQIQECSEVVHSLEAQKEASLATILDELSPFGVGIVSYDSLSPEEQAELRKVYLTNIFPLLTPQAVDPAHPFPFISNLSLNLLVTLRFVDSHDGVLARVKVPVGNGAPRFFQVGTEHRYVALEDIMRNNLDLLFPHAEILDCDIFFVTRNANTERDEESADDLLALIESEVRDRRFAPVVRVVVEPGMDATRRGRLAAELGLDETRDVFERKGLIAMRHLWELTSIDLPEQQYPSYRPTEPVVLRDVPNIFHAIRDRGAILLQHPYESFSHSVERFLREASLDPKVRGIKMTLYRTSKDSTVIESLIEAAQNGKQVAVVVELKARFDEAANIRWATRMEEAGIHVTYGVVGLKTHCKTILVVRQDYNRLRLYSHVGTGNYHAGTARQYDDLGLLTCDEAIGRDLVELFNYLTTGYTTPRNFQKLLPAPYHLKSGLIRKIRREIAHAKAGRRALIQFKTNALEDKDITRELYEASLAGVQIDLIVRDTCRLRPGIRGISDNVRVVSVVGRYLEHSRVYYFHNAGDDEYYIGSADLMNRNLEQRVEIICPVEPESLKSTLREIIDLHLTDQRNAWEMHSDGHYVQRYSEAEDAIGCHEALSRRATTLDRAYQDKRRVRIGKPVRRNVKLAN